MIWKKKKKIIQKRKLSLLLKKLNCFFYCKRMKKMIYISSHEICVGFLFVNKNVDLSNIFKTLEESPLPQSNECGIFVKQIIEDGLLDIPMEKIYLIKKLCVLLFAICEKKIIKLKECNLEELEAFSELTRQNVIKEQAYLNRSQDSKKINDLLNKIQQKYKMGGPIFLHG